MYQPSNTNTMSQYVDDICRLIHTTPKMWIPLSGNTIYKGLRTETIRIENAGLSGRLWWGPSIIGLHINDREAPLSGRDRRRLERAVMKWYDSAPLSTMLLIEGPRII